MKHADKASPVQGDVSRNCNDCIYHAKEYLSGRCKQRDVITYFGETEKYKLPPMTKYARMFGPCGKDGKLFMAAN